LASGPESSKADRERAPAAALRAEDAALVALVGNPNTGKTALFNALTGHRRHVANYPGVTVDVGWGRIRGTSRKVDLLDLPGTYSLAATSPDEAVLCDTLCGAVAGQRRPGAILAILDASNLQRNLYLLSQLLELGRPVVVALNMVDVARARGLEIDVEALSRRLGVPVVPVVATRPRTVAPLAAVIEEALGAAPPATRVALPDLLKEEAGALCAAAPGCVGVGEALRAIVDRAGHGEQQFLLRGGGVAELEAARERLSERGIDPGVEEIRARYAWVNGVLHGVVERRIGVGDTWSDRLDRVLTHKLAGGAMLLAVMYGLFYSIYTLSEPLMAAVEGGLGWVGSMVGAALPEGTFVQSMVQDGLIGGVGGVLAFLPQIMILFLFIALLEDCGYLARAAFMVDRLMRPLGLSGRAFIPLLSSFACAVPAVMGARAIADRRERAITILIIPFMSCSARLPVYVLLIGAFVPQAAWLGGWLRLDALVMLAMYLVGVLFAIPVAVLLRKTAFAGPPASFLLELPSYKLPRLRGVWQRVYLASRSFVVRAGTLILAVNLVVWALGYLPRSAETRAAVDARRAASGWSDAEYERALAGAYLRDSYLGRLGRAIEPAIEPLGWDWRIGIGVLASFPAREVIIATMGTVLNLGEEGGGARLQEAIRGMRREGTGEPVFTLAVALSVMVFFALCAQCSATLVVIGRELRSWGWPIASFFGMTTLAYLSAWAVSVGGRALGL
jgi:ferrous iron transport protein B